MKEVWHVMIDLCGSRQYDLFSLSTQNLAKLEAPPRGFLYFTPEALKCSRRKQKLTCHIKTPETVLCASCQERDQHLKFIAGTATMWACLLDACNVQENPDVTLNT